MEYTSLPVEEVNDPDSFSRFRSSKSQWTWHVAFLGGAYFLLAVWTFWTYFRPHTHQITKTSLYSPLESIVEYELVNWDFSRNIFMGSSSSKQDAAWHFLSRKGMSRLKSDEASQLYEKTQEWVGEPGTYVAGVDMFHQIHCLDSIRTEIWAKVPYGYHGKDDIGDPKVDHMMHCIEYLRLTLLCHGDISILPLQSDDHGWYQEDWSATRMCRKLEPLEKWMENRSVLNSPAFKHHIVSITSAPGPGSAHDQA